MEISLHANEAPALTTLILSFVSSQEPAVFPGQGLANTARRGRRRTGHSGQQRGVGGSHRRHPRRDPCSLQHWWGEGRFCAPGAGVGTGPGQHSPGSCHGQGFNCTMTTVCPTMWPRLKAPRPRGCSGLAYDGCITLEEDG